MSRLFWRFFLAIWLTIAGAIAFVVVINGYLGVLPPKGEMRDHRTHLAVESIVELVKAGKLEAARDFAATLPLLEPPAVVTITKRDDGMADACAPQGGMPKAVINPADGQCYLMSADETPLTIFEVYLPVVLPPLAALVTSLLSAWLLTRYLVRPVTTIREALAALAAGNFATRIGAAFRGRKDEVGRLGQDFDVAAAKLQDLQESQKRLFHDVSHELRSPLSRMQLAIGLIRRNPGKLDTVLPRMDREIERLDALVEEILTLARLGAAKSTTTELQAIDVVDLLQAIADDAAFEALPRGITVSYRGPDSFVSRLNGELIYRAIENVVRNALKYSPENAAVDVTAGIGAADCLDIVIANSGPFVPAEDVGLIFQPFVRLHGEETSTGHGLGLAITRSAIEAHGGEVSAKSNPGGGLTVSLRIPRHR
jgi:two-component system, OmpR family, sensor kinase